MRRALITLVLIAVAATGYWAYRHDERFKSWMNAVAGQPRQKAKAKARPAAPVRVAAAQKRDVPITLEGIGNVQALSTVFVKSRIDGQIMEAPVREGQLVARGDLLFKLDARPLQAQLLQAEASLARSKANLEKAKSDMTRFDSLAKRGFSPKTKAEEAETNVAALQADIRAAQAAVEIAKLNLAYATIQAPIDGRVGQILQTPGNMVKANDTQALLMIAAVKPINVAFALPEQHIGELRRRMALKEPMHVDVHVQGDDRQKERGTLSFINNVVDAITGTIQVMARFDNEAERLVPGQFVKAHVTMTTLKGATVAPTKSIQINQRGHYLWLLQADKTVKAQPVSIGPEVGESTVITRGIAPGDKVVTDGQLRLFPGSPVIIVDEGKASDKPKSQT